MNDTAIDAALVAHGKTRLFYGGFVYGKRHVIRDFSASAEQQEVWSMTQDGDDYETPHNAMMVELDRIAIRAAVRTYNDTMAILKERQSKP